MERGWFCSREIQRDGSCWLGPSSGGGFGRHRDRKSRRDASGTGESGPSLSGGFGGDRGRKSRRDASGTRADIRTWRVGAWTSADANGLRVLKRAEMWECLKHPPLLDVAAIV